jgi:Uma2 family endonuclease
VAVERRAMTAEELARLPDDGMRRELVRGEPRAMSPSGWEHGSITGRLAASLIPFVEEHDLGEVAVGDVGCILASDPDLVRAPDVAFIRRDRAPEGGLARGFFRGAPDLVVEVISPNDRYGDVAEKVADWHAHGTRPVGVVDPRWRTVGLHRPGEPARTLGDGDTIEGGDAVPGWSLAAGTLFGRSR